MVIKVLKHYKSIQEKGSIVEAAIILSIFAVLAWQILTSQEWEDLTTIDASAYSPYSNSIQLDFFNKASFMLDEDGFLIYNHNDSGSNGLDSYLDNIKNYLEENSDNNTGNLCLIVVESRSSQCFSGLNSGNVVTYYGYTGNSSDCKAANDELNEGFNNYGNPAPSICQLLPQDIAVRDTGGCKEYYGCAYRITFGQSEGDLIGYFKFSLTS